jgi:hypothetical protein
LPGAADAALLEDHEARHVKPKLTDERSVLPAPAHILSAEPHTGPHALSMLELET